jgi:hypothetical protein
MNPDVMFEVWGACKNCNGTGRLPRTSTIPQDTRERLGVLLYDACPACNFNGKGFRPGYERECELVSLTTLKELLSKV